METLDFNIKINDDSAHPENEKKPVKGLSNFDNDTGGNAYGN